MRCCLVFNGFKKLKYIVIWGLLRWLKEKETATHSSILAWVIPWTEEPGGLQSIGS